MIEAIVKDIERAFGSSFLSGDWRTIALAVGAATIGALIMGRRGQIGSVTLLALLLFAVGGLLRGLFAPRAEGVSLVDRAVALVKDGVLQLLDMQAGLLIAYFIAFMVVVFAVFGIKTAVGSRGGGHH